MGKDQLAKLHTHRYKLFEVARTQAITRRITSRTIHVSDPDSKKAQEDVLSTSNSLNRQEQGPDGEEVLNTTLAAREDKCLRCWQDMLMSPNGSHLKCGQCMTCVANLDFTAAAFSFEDEPDFVSIPQSKGRPVEEFLASMQAKNGKKVEAEVITAVMEHIVTKQGIGESKLVQRIHINVALSSLGLKKKYSQYLSQIYCRITSTQPPFFTNNEKQIIRTLCATVESVFPRAKNDIAKTRKTFFSYLFLFNRLIHMMGWEKYYGACGLLKPKDRLVLQDDLFCLYCYYLRWKPVPPPEDCF